MPNRIINIIAAFLLTIMFLLAIFSVRNDSAIMDEVAHLPAGYSYITQKDMRINPEHPPLIKDISGIGAWIWSKISGTPINFPDDIKAWKNDINGQWDFGFNFLYSANAQNQNADKILFWGRFPMILLMVLLGFYVFKWTKELFGKTAALLALFFYSFSPTFIAHGRFVTTDVAAAAAFFIGLYYFIKWIKNPTRKNLIIAGLVFGLALLAKFSLFLIIPLMGFLIVVWTIIQIIETRKNKATTTSTTITALTAFSKNIGSLILIGLIGMIFVVWPIYLYHVWNYPVERQVDDMQFVMSSYARGPIGLENGKIIEGRGNFFRDNPKFLSCKIPTLIKNKEPFRIARCPVELTFWMAEKPILRPFAQYVYGFLMVIQRATGGNTTYFMGEVSASGWKSYFPIVYLLKEPLALHIFTIIALILAIIHIVKSLKQKKYFQRLITWIKNHFTEFSMFSIIVLYWYTSLTSNLNIGVRHILPTIPFIYVLISGQITKWMRFEKINTDIHSVKDFFRYLWTILVKVPIKYLIFIFLILWQFFSVIAIYPSYLAYFNELTGGAKNGYEYVTDSNLDWGQDLKRLAAWTNNQKINEIYVDYFGGATKEYYLGNKIKPWWGTKSHYDLKPGDYLAISATSLQGGRGKPVEGFNQDYGYYKWLDEEGYKPIAIIGYSIFVYQIK